MKKRKNKKPSECQIDILGSYAIFLEHALEEIGINLSESGIMEITDEKFNVVSDHLGNELLMPSRRIITIDHLDGFLENPSDDVDIVYSQLPFVNSKLLIKKLSLVPAMTNAVALLGTYGYKKDFKFQERDYRYLNKFSEALVRNGFEYEHMSKQTSIEHFDLIVSRNKFKILERNYRC